MMLILTRRLPANLDTSVQFTLRLTAEERTHSRHRFPTHEGTLVQLHLPRGTVLFEGDLLQPEAEEITVRVVAKPEPVCVITAPQPLDLLRAAYHLGNRHVLLETYPRPS